MKSVCKLGWKFENLFVWNMLVFVVGLVRWVGGFCWLVVVVCGVIEWVDRGVVVMCVIFFLWIRCSGVWLFVCSGVCNLWLYVDEDVVCLCVKYG